MPDMRCDPEWDAYHKMALHMARVGRRLLKAEYLPNEVWAAVVSVSEMGLAFERSVGVYR